MGTNDTLQKALKELRAQADALRNDLRETDDAIAAIERIVSSPRKHGRAESKPPKPTEPEVEALKDASWADGAEWALRQKGKPMHSMEIVKALQKARYRANENPKKLKLSLVGAVARNARKGRRFVQLGNGMYALKEWNLSEDGGNATPDKLPPNG